MRKPHITANVYLCEYLWLVCRWMGGGGRHNVGPVAAATHTNYVKME